MWVTLRVKAYKGLYTRLVYEARKIALRGSYTRLVVLYYEACSYKAGLYGRVILGHRVIDQGQVRVGAGCHLFLE